MANFNRTGGFNSNDILASKSIDQLLRWKQILHNDISMLKNSLDMDRRSDQWTEESRQKFLSRRMALRSQTALMSQLECQLGLLRRKEEQAITAAYAAGWNDAKADS